ncbi:MAG: hypothetical protein M4579_004143 [Chaenotheca gracillima]|nr:MAG: hypothetical protein M4579_004143 [Chaenotheca gracillima]
MSDQPPPAPPLPPQRYVNRAANALSRFAQPFIGGSRPPSSQANRAGDLSGRPGPPAPPRAPSTPLSSQTATHQAGISIAAVDISPQRTHAVLAGRDLLKTIRVSGASCTEQFNLRAATIASNASGNRGAGSAAFKYRDDLAANDVKWSHGSHDTTIATAAPNGKIVLFDVNRSEVQVARLHEHNRQVHKLAFNPHQGFFLLSGSQDGTMRLWDLRTASAVRNISAARSESKYKANAEGIRDVKWCPTDGVSFACATDVGIVQRWDIRKDNAPTLKVNAHRKTCMSIDWHPDGKHLTSAGLDGMVQVWDFSSTNRRQNASWSFKAPEKVHLVRWRPVGWHPSKSGLGLWQTTQVVTSYNELDSRIHVWNFKRPHVAVWEIDRYNSSPSDMLWRSEDLLWTVGTEGIFTQTDLHFVPRVEDRRALQAVDIAADGELTFFLRRRPKRHSQVVEGTPDTDSVGDRAQAKISSGEKLSGDKSSGSRSATDDEISGNFLTSSFRRRTAKTWRSKTSKSAENTPPSDITTMAVAKLDETLPKRAQLSPVKSQLSASGHLPRIFDAKAFRWLASRSLFDLETAQRYYRQLRDTSLDEQIEAVFHLNSYFASSARSPRRQQTWRIASYTVMRELRARGQVQRALRLRREAAESETSKTEKSKTSAGLKEDKKLDSGTRFAQPNKFLAASESGVGSRLRESSSNVSTPLALPMSEHDEHGSPLHPRLDEEDALMLPSAARDHDIDIDEGRPRTPDRFKKASEGIGRRDVRSNPPNEHGSDGLPDVNVLRQDSAESFDLFSVSMDGSDPKRSQGGSFSTDGDMSFDNSPPIPWVETDHKYLIGNKSSQSKGQNPESGELGISSSGSEPLQNSQANGSVSVTRQEENLQASGTIVPEYEDNNPHEAPPSPNLPALQVVPPTSAPFVASDFERMSKLHPLIGSLSPKPPFTAASMLPHLLEHHTTQLNDVLLPSSLILLLQPLIDLSPLDLPPQQATSILSAYHDQLISLGLDVPAAHLRRLTYPNPVHRSIWEPALLDTRVTIMCSTCGNRLNGIDRLRGADHNTWSCGRCEALLAPCPVCECRKGRGLWAWCQGCGHGGHECCLGQWWASPKSEGGCATQGCRHDCVPGKRRDERVERSAKEQAKTREKSGLGVRKDDWVAGESRAVERVRSGGLLIGAGNSPGERNVGGPSAGGGGLGSRATGSPGLGGKRVKVVTPSEERQR